MAGARSVKLVIEGAEADIATRQLFALGWFEGEWAEQRRHSKDPGLIAISAQVLALGGGSVTIADNLLQWWEKWQKTNATATRPLKVTFESPSGTKVPLDGATRDDIADVLRTLHSRS
jgi:hypothetical protein